MSFLHNAHYGHLYFSILRCSVASSLCNKFYQHGSLCSLETEIVTTEPCYVAYEGSLKFLLVQGDLSNTFRLQTNSISECQLSKTSVYWHWYPVQFTIMPNYDAQVKLAIL